MSLIEKSEGRLEPPPHPKELKTKQSEKKNHRVGSRGWRGLVKRSCRGTRDACFAPLGCALISMRLPGKIRLARRLMSSPSRSGCQPARERLSPPCAPLTPAGKLVFAQAAPPFLSAEETCRSAEAGLMFYGGTGCPALLLNLTKEEGVPPPVWRTPPRTTSRSPFSQSPRVLPRALSPLPFGEVPRHPVSVGNRG